MHNSLTVEIRQTRGQLGHPKANNILRKIAPGIKMICHDPVGTPAHDDIENGTYIEGRRQA